MVGELVEVINSGNQSAQHGFVTSNVSERGQKETPPDRYLSILEKVEAVDCRSVGNIMEARLSSMKGGRWARLYMIPDKVEPGKVLEFGFVPLDDPRGDVEDPWSGKKRSEEEVMDEIDGHVERLARFDGFSGVILVALNERILYHKAFGCAERSFRVPNMPDTMFNLGSMNKMFTSVALAQLVASTQLSFQDRLADVLPDYPNQMAASKITIHHLLSHTAGLGMLFDSPLYDRQKRYENHTELMAVFANNPPVFEPGTNYS